MLCVGSRCAVRGQGLTDVSLVLVIARDVRRACLMTCSCLGRGMSMSRVGSERMDLISLSSFSRAE